MISLRRMHRSLHPAELFDFPSNNNFQRVPVNSNVPIPLDFLLFRADGNRDNGVGIAPADTARFPKYPGGLIVRDKNGDGALDPAVDEVIGGIIPLMVAGAYNVLTKTWFFQGGTT